MSSDNRPLVSIIVPTYNEENDIARTMDALAAQTYRPLEVIVVDASKDRTPDIVRSYEACIPGLKLIPQGAKPGVSAARNLGLQAATGMIVCILNADVFPDCDFVERIVPHYAEGADYLLVQSEVVNIHEGIFPRFIQAQHTYKMNRYFEQEANWTEGFSCRREAALAVGGFPEEFGRNSAGEDVIFGDRLQAKYRRVADLTIIVKHVMPIRFKDYWRQRLGRGRGGAFRLYAYEKRSMRWGAMIRSVIGTLAFMGTLFPVVRYSWWLTEYSPNGRRDLLAFTWARLIELTARALGYWEACVEIAHNNRLAKQETSRRQAL